MQACVRARAAHFQLRCVKRLAAKRVPLRTSNELDAWVRLIQSQAVAPSQRLSRARELCTCCEYQGYCNGPAHKAVYLKRPSEWRATSNISRWKLCVRVCQAAWSATYCFVVCRCVLLFLCGQVAWAIICAISVLVLLLLFFVLLCRGFTQLWRVVCMFLYKCYVSYCVFFSYCLHYSYWYSFYFYHCCYLWFCLFCWIRIKLFHLGIFFRVLLVFILISARFVFYLFFSVELSN